MIDPPTQLHRADGPVRSDYRNDPDLRDIIELFVQEMPARIQAFESIWNQQAFDELKRQAHQLKGAGGGYGFPELSSAAARLENALGHVSAQAQAQQLKQTFDELIDLCRRVTF